VRTIQIASLVVVALALPGCLSLGGEPPEIRRHSIDLPEVAPPPADHVFGPIIVRQFAARGRYEPRVVVRDAPGRLTYLETDRWVEEPSEAVTTVVRESVAASGLFEAVAASTSEMRTDLVLDGALLACDLVPGGATGWSAHLVLRLEVTQRSSGEMVASSVYESRKALPGPSTDGLGAAMGDCVEEIVARAIADWRHHHRAELSDRESPSD